MVLAGQDFRATESTHGRRIWELAANYLPEIPNIDREVLLWDLAGQPGYRIVHQLHLAGAALALIVFDSKSETGPLLGVRHWARATRHAHPLAAGGLPIFLVAARVDRGGSVVSPERVKQVMTDFAIDDYVATSAKENENIELLRSRILAALDWDRQPKITSTALFAAMKQFVVSSKLSSHALIPVTELREDFQQTVPGGSLLLTEEQRTAAGQGYSASSAELAAIFDGCVARLEAAGLVKRLKFGDLILLRPELLDAYASAIVNAARDEPDGLGSILEDRVINLEFHVPLAERVLDDRQARLLMVATLEELIQHELVLREPTDLGVQLLFPSAYRRDLPRLEGPGGDGVIFRFEGPIDNVYATLIVRLARSTRFRRIDTWQSAAKFATGSGECTILLTSDGEGEAELSIGYDSVPHEVRAEFERFVHVHLDRRAVLGSVRRERQFACPDDGTAFTSQQVDRARTRGRMTIICPVCESRVSLEDYYEPAIGHDRITAAMDASADRGRESAAASTVLRGKEEVAEFDVFLCHNFADKPAVRNLAQQLRERGLRPWLDEEVLRPGLPWQRALEGAIQDIPAVAVIIGSSVGPWQDQEIAAFLRQFIRRGCPVIPVLLPGTESPSLPVYLDGLTWVDLGQAGADPLDRLEWGIRGRHPSR